MRERSSPHVAIIGAGAFGGWAAWHLRRAGCAVTLLDAFGAGNARASSGDETRIIRHAYGTRRYYVPLVRRSVELWREIERASGVELMRLRGVLWLASGDGAFERASLAALVDAGVEHRVLDAAELARDYPHMRSDDVRFAFLEVEAGVLLARRGCEVVADAVRASGGEVRRAGAAPGPIANGRMQHVTLDDGSRLEADAYVFATGPWMARQFPELLATILHVTRQEVLSFGLPPGDRAHHDMPVWADHGEVFWYGIPDGLSHGFKVGEDTRGPEFDPTDGERLAPAAQVARARAYLAHRFPRLAGAPLVDSRVCQYTLTRDEDFIVDRHPAADNVWLAGGGSGHGYKLGPAVGELAASLVLGAPPRAEFRLARFDDAARERKESPR